MSIDPQAAAGLRAGLLGQLAAEHHTTIVVIEHVPEDKLGYRVHAKMRTFAELAHHIYLSGVEMVSVAEKGRMNLAPGDARPTPPIKSALLTECAALNREIADRINAFSPESLARIIDLPGSGPLPTVTYLGLHLYHLIHHRGQLAVYLRLMGTRVPKIYGPTLDYPT